MTEAVPAEQAVSAEKKRPLLRRVPTSMIVTLLGIALTAWLLPAFTRQWDDRQKAHELKATLVSEMATVTARLLEQERASLYQRTPRPKLQSLTESLAKGSSLPGRDSQWAMSSIQVQSQLAAYFPLPMVPRWRAYKELVTSLVQWLDGTGGYWTLVTGLKDAKRIAALERIRVALPQAGPPVTTSSVLEELTKADDAFVKLEDDVANGTLSRDEFAITWILRNSAEINAWEDAEIALLAVETVIAHEVLAAHPMGFSTTTHDLLHDLIP